MSKHQASDTQLIANGYEPLVVDGKAAVAEFWQSGTVTVERIAAERAEHPNADNTGLRTGELVGVDIDVVDADQVALIIQLATDRLGVTPLQRFGSKGRLLCYRNEMPVRKVTIRNASDQKVEVLGVGLQFVAFGIHPGTGQPFKWLGVDEFGAEATPLTVPLDQLPEVTPAQLIEFANECSKLFASMGYKECRVQIAQEAERKTNEGVALDEPHNIDRAIEHLKNCVAQGKVAILGQLGNDTIYELACAMFDRFSLSPEKTEELMLDIWYPHCIPNTFHDDARTIISNAASYMQNEPGALAVPAATSAFGAALDKLPPSPSSERGPNDLGDAQPIVLNDENADEDDLPCSAGSYMGKEFPPLRELVPVWCERNINTLLEGPAATQKSRAALQDAIALSAGLPSSVGKEPNEQCGALYLNYENSPEEMARRVHNICKVLRADNTCPEVDPSAVAIWELRQNPRPILMVKRDGVLITRFGKRMLKYLADRKAQGLHTFVVFDGLMDAIIFHDNTRNDDTVAMGLIRLLDSWCMEYDFTAYSIVHPSRSSERGNTAGSYATAWTTKPRAIQTFRRVLSPYAGGGPKAKITEDTRIEDIYYQRRVQKRSNGPEGDRMLLEYHKGGLRPHLPKTNRAPTGDAEPDTSERPEPELEEPAF